jgi:hypothetical protein
MAVERDRLDVAEFRAPTVAAKERERIRDGRRIGGARRGLSTHAVRVRAEAVAEEEAVVLRGACFLETRDVAAAIPLVIEDEAAEREDAPRLFFADSAMTSMARHQGVGRILRFEEVEDLVLHRELGVIDLDHHLLLDQPPDEMTPEIGEAARVAVRVAGIVDRQRPARRVADRLRERIVACRQRRADELASGAVVVRQIGTAVRVPETAGVEEVPDVQEEVVEDAGAAVRIVELVDGEDGANAEIVELVELSLDRRLVALRDVELQAAIEEMGRFDAEDDRELSFGDDLARLRGRSGIRNQPSPGPPACASM